MKKFNVSKLSLAFILGLGLASLNANLTPEEQRSILEKCEITETDHPEKKILLDSFFEDKTVKEVFIDRKKPLNLAWMYQNIQPPEIAARCCQSFQRAFHEIGSVYGNRIEKIKKDLDVSILPGNTFIIRNVLTGFVVKVPMFNVPLLEAGQDDSGKNKDDIKVCYDSDKLLDPYFNETVSKYQLVSRVFYNEKINKFVNKNNFKHVRCLEEYLYNLPGKGREVCDENYVVVQEAVQKSNFRFEDIFNKVCFPQVLSENEVGLDWQFIALLKELCAVIKQAALWDITPANVFLIKENGVLKVVFVGAVRPAWSGSEERWFFHKDNPEIVGNIDDGFKALAKSMGITHKFLLEFTSNVLGVSHDYLLEHKVEKVRDFYNELELSSD